MHAPIRWFLPLLVLAEALCCSMSDAEEPPAALKGYDKKRVSIIGYPVLAAAFETATTDSDTKAVLKSPRMTGVSKTLVVKTNPRGVLINKPWPDYLC